MTNQAHLSQPAVRGNEWEVLLSNLLEKGIITQRDGNLIKAYLVWKMADCGISPVRQKKLYFSIAALRRAADCEFIEWDDTVFRTAVITIRTQDYAEWTKSDIIGQSKAFLKWCISQDYLPNLSLSAVESVKTPKAPKITKTPAELPTIDDIYKLLQYPTCKIQSQALIATAFWSGARISELLRLNWSDVIFSPHHVTLRIRDTKTKRIRSVPAAEPLPYLASWRRQYPPLAGTPDGNNPVFIAPKKNGYKRAEYDGVSSMLKRLQEAAGVKHCTWHTFRAANITNSSLAGVPDSVIKAIHWGNQNSQMMATYTLLSDEASEREMLRRAGLEVEEVKIQHSPQNCPSCCALNGPGDQYCRMCGHPLSSKAVETQKALDEAVAYVQQNYTPEQMIKNMARVLQISEDAARKLLTGGI